MKLSNKTGIQSPLPLKNFRDLSEQFGNYLGMNGRWYKEGVENAALYKHVFNVPTVLGIEVEVESINKELPIPGYWTMKGDGSLRNSGREFVSTPMSPEQAFVGISILWRILDKMCGGHDFSWRTSIHVHLNVLDMEEEEFQKLMLLCIVFEDLFFELVGNDRREGVFCIPITRSTHHQELRKFFQGNLSVKQLSQRWQKYSACNIARLFGGGPGQEGAGLGTVEFRHLGGTKDIRVVMTWISMILQLYQAAITLSKEKLHGRILDLNTSSKYVDFINSVFTPEVTSRLHIKDFAGIMSNTISRTKEMLVKAPKFGKIQKDSPMMAYILSEQGDAIRKYAAHIEGEKQQLEAAFKAKLAAVAKAGKMKNEPF